MSKALNNPTTQATRAANLEKFTKSLTNPQVEEHIEEITTRYQSSDEENEPIVECLQKFNLSAGHRAHFPELGKDVVDGNFILCIHAIH